MRAITLLRTLLALKQTRVTAFEVTDHGLEVEVAPTTRVPYCSACMGRARHVYDHRSREWRHLDFVGMEVTLKYRQRRVACRRCGELHAELVPWAEPGSRFTADFEDQAAYFAQVMDRTTTSRMLRIAWRTVGQIIERVVARLDPADRLEDLEYIGLDELSYRKHHEYITIVVDHVGSKVVWAAKGKSAATVNEFFKALGPERAAKLKGVTIDMSAAYIEAVRRGAPAAQIIFDRFHVQRMAQDAVDQLRREQFRLLAGTADAKALKKTRWALLKSPWNLTAVEGDKLVEVQRDNRPLYRAYLLKESLAEIFNRRQVNVAREKFIQWCRWAARSRARASAFGRRRARNDWLIRPLGSNSLSREQSSSFARRSRYRSGMSLSGPISNTARLTAAERERERERERLRPDRLFDDPSAESLAGPEGFAFMERFAAVTRWSNASLWAALRRG